MRNEIRLSRIIPAILAGFFLLDFLLRFLPTTWFTFRAWEAATRYPAQGAPFEANLRYRLPEVSGDLAYFGNFPGLRQPHAELFTTDAWGFRNGPAGAAPFQAILVGDSFSAGSSLNDHETFAARLSHGSGVRVYNAAGTDLELRQFDRVLHRLGRSRGLLIYQLLRPTDKPHVYFSQGREGNLYRSTARGFWTISPIRILSERVLRYAQNGRLLPNTYKKNIVGGILRNGEPMMFYPFDVEQFFHPQRAGVEYFLWLQREAKRRGLDLVVVLVPDKFQTYYPLLKDPPELFPGFFFPLDDLATQLGHSGIPVVNLRQPLAQAAAKAYGSGQLLYWRDDTHWNAAGVQSASDMVLPFVQKALLAHNPK